MDIQKERKACETTQFNDFGLDVKDFKTIGEYFRLLGWLAAKDQAVPDGFVLVPKADVHDHYVAEHFKGTTCSVDVSELTGNVGDRVYGKLRPYDCIGSDGNTLLYDLESSNFNMQRHTGNSGDYVLVPVASISTFYQDDDEPENFANLDDGVSVLGDCCDLDDIVVINKIEQANISTTKMWGAFKVADGTSNFTLFNNELDAIAARDETVGHYMEVHA